MITPLINLLGFGEEQAISLGVPLNLLRTGLLFVAIGLAASSVGYTGNLSFIGLLAPHIAKRLIGKRISLGIDSSGNDWCYFGASPATQSAVFYFKVAKFLLVS